MDQGVFPTDGDSTKTYSYVSMSIPFSPTNRSYTDLTGMFLWKLVQGKQYLFVLTDFNLNVILAIAIKNRQAKTLVTAWETLDKQLTQHGHETKHYIMDNEVSADIKAALKSTISPTN
eukprot:14126349-Ditylum_brightwellii.AAC.1